MTALCPPVSHDCVIGRVQVFFVHPSEPGILRRRRRRRRGKRRAGLLPPMVAELGDVAVPTPAERSAQLEPSPFR